MASITKITRNKHLVRIRIAGYPQVSRQFDHLNDAQVFATKTDFELHREKPNGAIKKSTALHFGLAAIFSRLPPAVRSHALTRKDVLLAPCG